MAYSIAGSGWHADVHGWHFEGCVGDALFEVVATFPSSSPGQEPLRKVINKRWYDVLRLWLQLNEELPLSTVSSGSVRVRGRLDRTLMLSRVKELQQLLSSLVAFDPWCQRVALRAFFDLSSDFARGCKPQTTQNVDLTVSAVHEPTPLQRILELPEDEDESDTVSTSAGSECPSTVSATSSATSQSRLKHRKASKPKHNPTAMQRRLVRKLGGGPPKLSSSA
jgi:hypothetical protein